MVFAGGSGDADALDTEELLDAVPPALFSEAAETGSAEGPVHRQVGRAVDQHLAADQGLGDAMGPAQVVRLYIGGEAVASAVGDRDRFVLGVEWGDRQNRPEHLLLGQL